MQGTEAAIAEVAAIIDSQPCGRPLCYRTDVLDHRIEVYNGRAGAGMCKVQGTSGACIEFAHARFRLSSCEGKAKDYFRACQGFEGLEVLIQGAHGRRSSDLGVCVIIGLARNSRQAAAAAASQEPGARRAGTGRQTSRQTS